uniref:SusC/RagA family TonB-linked outer membrane protein n=2 Tax=Chitinophaga TaxID=79328 RepID=UPI002FDEF969
NSISSPTKEVELADPVTYMELANEAVTTRNPNALKLYSQEKIANTRAGLHPVLYPATDWKQMLLKDRVVNHRANLNVSGGGKVARYYVAATFNNNINLKTYGLRSNVNINLTKTTEALVRLNTTWSDYTGPIKGGADVYRQIMRTNPVLYPAFYQPDAQHMTTEHIMFGNYDAGQFSNPYADMMKGYRDYTNAMTLAQFEIKQDLSFIAKGLKLSGMYNTTRYNYYTVSRNYNPFFYTVGSYDKQSGDYTLAALNPEAGTEYLGYSEGDKDVSSENYFQGILSYEHHFNSRNTLNGMLVYTMLNKLQANAGTLQNSLPHRNMGLAGRFTYALAEKYFVEANFGYNGSERFYKSHRFGFFPSIGGAWYVSREPFWEPFSKTVSNLKLRGTYGLVGNDAIGSSSERFFFLSEVNMNSAPHSYLFGSEFTNTITGIAETRYENRNISWETAKKLNLSAEIGLFGFINIIADVYRESRSGILMTRSHIPNTMGLLTLPKANVGAATSKGFDLSLEMNKQFSRQFYLSGRANFTYATSEFTTYEEPDYRHAPWKSRIGHSLGQSWGYVAERLFVDDKEVLNSPFQPGQVMGGDIKYKDINGDGKIDALDQVPIGFPTTPEIVYGFGLSAGYRNFDLSCFFQGLARESFWIDASATAPFIGAEGSSNQLLKVYADDHWSEENRNIRALWPRLSHTANTNNSARSTWFMRDGSFLRLKQLELGYSVPAAFMKRAGIEKLRVYANGSNLFSFSKFKGPGNGRRRPGLSPATHH